jgi:hypothetical protein
MMLTRRALLAVFAGLPLTARSASLSLIPVHSVCFDRELQKKYVLLVFPAISTENRNTIFAEIDASPDGF